MSPRDVLDMVLVVLVIMAIAGAICGGAYLLSLALRRQPLVMPIRLLFRVYLAAMSIVSLLILTGGIAHLVNAGFSEVFDRDFSYYPVYVGDAELEALRKPDAPAPVPTATPTPVPGAAAPASPTPVPTPTPEEKELLRQEGLQRSFEEGLLSGVSYTLVGGLLWFAHVWGRRKVETPEERRDDVLDRLYLLVVLLIFGIVTVVSLPSAVDESLRYFILDYNDRRQPGEELAVALVSLPVLLIYLRGTIQSIRN